MALAVQHVRRTAKLLASLATLWAAFIAFAVAVSWSDGSWQALAYIILVVATLVAQVVFIGAAAVREQSEPRLASLLYTAAVLCLVPEHLLILLR